MKTLLIIDDERDLCALLRKALKNDDFFVDCAHTIAEADSKLRSTEADIILLDNNLPDGSGLDFYNLYAEKFKKSRVVFITADSAIDIDERADMSSVHAFIRKPFTVSVLKDTIKRLK